MPLLGCVHIFGVGLRQSMSLCLFGTALFILMLLHYSSNQRGMLDMLPDLEKPRVDLLDNIELNDYVLRSPNPAGTNRRFPRARHCMHNRDAYIADLRESQRRRVDYWWRADINDEMKWVLIANVYASKLVNLATFFRFVSDSETKYFMDFVREPQSCNVVTLGVGMDYTGEENFYKRYRMCQFWAADPMRNVNSEKVAKVPGARFVEATLGAEDGNYTARIIGDDHAYRTVTVEHKSLVRFFREQNLANQTIDALMMDIEGAELGILPHLIDNMSDLPTICQMNVELHWPPESYGFTSERALANLHRFLSNGTYSVMNVVVIRRFLRMYAINTANSECVEKFFC